VVEFPPWLFLYPNTHWHVILYSGASMNRHLNDLEFLYRTLVNRYRVPPWNITVLNFDGTLTYNDANWMPHQGSIGNWPGNNTPYQIHIDESGTKDNLVAAVEAMATKLGPNDNLLLHTNNHGNRVNNTSTIISYSGDDTTPDDLTAAIEKLPKFQCFMVMMEQCYSGGFVQPILDASPASCTSVATAADAYHTSAGGPDFDPFALDWIEAMAGTTADGTAVSTPAGSDPPTAQQAFDWALATDTGVGDTPQFGSSGGGAGCRFGAPRWYIPIPVNWRYLFPWEILPDPGPDEILDLATQVDALAREGKLTEPVGSLFASVQERLSVLVANREDSAE
jgi:hypothetical protein